MSRKFSALFVVLVLAGSLSINAVERPASTQAATKPVVYTPQKVADLVPRDLRGDFNSSMYSLAKESIETTLLKQRVEIKLKLASSPSGGRWRADAKPVAVKVNGEAFEFTATLFFEKNSAAIAKIKDGDSVKLSGLVSAVQCNVIPRHSKSDAGPGIHLVFEECELAK